MDVLIVQHVESEGPGTIGAFLADRGAVVHTVRAYAGEWPPADPTGCDAIVSMGGPMNVYEEDRYPFLRAETGLLARAVEAGVPVLGVCLGAQMIAKACGARVTRSPEKEVGWGVVTLTAAGRDDAMFHGLPGVLPVFQWHEDMFEVPAGGRLLAQSAACPHQAFRVRNAYGLQFHVEVTADMLAAWFAGSPALTAVLDRFAELQPDLEAFAHSMFSSFFSLAADRPAPAR